MTRDTADHDRVRVLTCWALAVPVSTLLAYAGLRKVADAGRDVVDARVEVELQWIWDPLPEVVIVSGLVVGLAEMAAAVLLLTVRWRRIGAAATLGLAYVWALFIVCLEAIGVSPAACGCFGSGPQLSHMQHLIVIGATAVMGYGVLHMSHGRRPASA